MAFSILVYGRSSGRGLRESTRKEDEGVRHPTFNMDMAHLFLFTSHPPVFVSSSLSFFAPFRFQFPFGYMSSCIGFGSVLFLWSGWDGPVGGMEGWQDGWLEGMFIHSFVSVALSHHVGGFDIASRS